MVYAGGEGGTLVALEATDGGEQWRTTLGALLEATPTIADQTVFVVGRHGVYAVDAATGEERWRVDTMHNRYAFPTPPAVVGKTVYVGAGDGALHALDAATGIDRWESLPDLANYVASEPRFFSDVIVFATQFGGGIVALDAATGELRWNYPPDMREEMLAPAVIPAPAGDVVYVTGALDLAALDATTGVEQWCVTLDSPASWSLVGDEVIYAGTDDAGMIALLAHPVAGTLDATPAGR
jgi:outer membrane protein assembly factor BamB